MKPEEKLLELLAEKKSYWQLLAESRLDFNSLDYYLLKLKKMGKIKRLKDGCYIRISSRG